MKYKIIITEEQLRVLENCTNLYMRVLMGQTMDMTELLTDHYLKGYSRDDPNSSKVFDKFIIRRDAVRAMLDAIMRIAYDNQSGIPKEKSEDCMIAECMNSAIRLARGVNRWGRAFQIGSEPSPKIEEIDDGNDG